MRHFPCTFRILAVIVSMAPALGCHGATEKEDGPAAAMEQAAIAPSGPAPSILSRSVDELSFDRGDLPGADVVESSDDAIAKVVSVSLHCHCQKPGEEAAAFSDERQCAMGETRHCSEGVKLVTFAPGDVTLTLTNANGQAARSLVQVRDAAAMRLQVRLAERLENGFSFRPAPPLDATSEGGIELPVDAVAVVDMRLYDALGLPLRFDWTEGFDARVAEGTSLALEPCGHACGPNSRTGTVVRGLQIGDSHLAFEGRNVSSAVRIRIVD